MKPKEILKFPNGFLWGAGGSAYQTEGNNTNADWWAWENSLGRENFVKTRKHDPEQYKSGIACDFYNRYDEDFALAQHLNHNVTRIGLEWSRIQPKEGIFDEKALDHYEKILQSAKFHGLSVFLTLHHFTNPIWFAKKGAFTKKENLPYFTNFVQRVAERLGEYVDFWVTVNEPEVYSTYSYLLGIFPPNKKSIFLTIKVVNNLISAHNQASEILRFKTGKPVGLAYHLADIVPIGLFGGLVKRLAHFFANVFIVTRTIGACDYIGVNYYNHHHIGVFGPRRHSGSKHKISDLGWGIHPEGLERVLLFLKTLKKPIYITENGLADAKDEKREKFIKDHLYYTHSAIAGGADVRGYIYWSMMDNFEWQHGFWPRFGLVEIDREDFLRRKVRYSATKFAEICKNNYLEYQNPEEDELNTKV